MDKQVFAMSVPILLHSVASRNGITTQASPVSEAPTPVLDARCTKWRHGIGVASGAATRLRGQGVARGRCEQIVPGVACIHLCRWQVQGEGGALLERTAYLHVAARLFDRSEERRVGEAWRVE